MDNKLGLLFKEDLRDYTLDNVVGLTANEDYPKEYKISYFLKKPIYQYNVGACAGCATAFTTTIQLYGDEQLSQWFIYANRSKSDFQGKGLYIRQVLKRLIEDGVCTIDLFEYVKEYPEIKEYLDSLPNKKEIYENANKHKITGYVRIYKNEVKSMISQGYPVLLGLDVYENFYDCKTNGGIIPAEPNGKLKGGHEVVIYGYDEDYYYIKNWWQGHEDLKLAINSSIIYDYYIITDKPIKKNIEGWEKVEVPHPSGTKTKWKYRNNDGSYKTGWLLLNSIWYYLDPNTYYAYDGQWLKGNNDWYYFEKDSCKLLSGWYKVDGYWYYGETEHNGYYGKMKTGFINVNGKFYYLEEREGYNQGHCYIDCSFTINGQTYYADENGVIK
jgi:hypothetical protein